MKKKNRERWRDEHWCKRNKQNFFLSNERYFFRSVIPRPLLLLSNKQNANTLSKLKSFVTRNWSQHTQKCNKKIGAKTRNILAKKFASQCIEQTNKFRTLTTACSIFKGKGKKQIASRHFSISKHLSVENVLRQAFPYLRWVFSQPSHLFLSLQSDHVLKSIWL